MDDHLTPATPTILEYYHDMSKLQSKAALVSSILGDDGRRALILDCTIFHPQGGGQPSDTGFITDVSSSRFKFLVQDVRSKNGIVYHYGVFDKTAEDLEGGVQVVLSVDESRRKLNSRLHSAGHLLDVCMQKVGLGHLEPGKGYHFPDGIFTQLCNMIISNQLFPSLISATDFFANTLVADGGVCCSLCQPDLSYYQCSTPWQQWPYVEYKGTVPHAELQSKQKELELEANNLISRGGKVSVAVYPYEEASELCGGGLPDYIPKGSSPRIVKLGDFPGCPCGGTHVSDISELSNMKVTQMRTKKGLTKVYYNIGC